MENAGQDAVTKTEGQKLLSSNETAVGLDYAEQRRDSTSIRAWLRDNVFLGIDPTPDVVAIASIYFVEGALGLAPRQSK